MMGPLVIVVCNRRSSSSAGLREGDVEGGLGREEEVL